MDRLPRFHSSETVYLLGGGASLRGVDLRWLSKKRGIAVNDAILAWPAADILFSLDGTFFTRPAAARTGPIVAALPEERFRFFGLDRRPNAVRYERVISPGLSRVPGTIHAGNSGFGALDLAVQLGARRIVLLGYDLVPTADPHAFREANARYSIQECARHVRQFSSAVPDLLRLGVSVTNANRSSAIHCFPFSPRDRSRAQKL